MATKCARKESKDEHTTDSGGNKEPTQTHDEVHMAKADVLKRLLTDLAHSWNTLGLQALCPKQISNPGLKCSIGEVANRIQASELQTKVYLQTVRERVANTRSSHPKLMQKN